MTIAYSDQQTEVQAGRFVQRAAYDQGAVLGWDTYTAAALASGSTINCWTPPKGFKFSGGKLYFASLGTSVTLAVGIGASTNDSTITAVTNKFLTATAAATAGSAVLAPAVADADYAFDGFTPITITTGGASATGAIKLRVDGSLSY